MDYRPPSFRQPQNFDIPRTLDDLFNNYIQGREQENQSKLQGLALREQYGTDPRQMSSEQLGRGFAGPTMTPGAPPMLARTPADAQPQPQFDQDPHVSAIQRYMERKRSGQAMGVQKESLGMDLTRSQIAENRAQANALNRNDIYFDPASGKQMSVPRGAKPLPAGTGQQGKMLPPASVLNLNEGAAVSRQLPDVEAALKEAEGMMGPFGGRKGAMNPYDTQAQTLDARFRTASQAFGRFMEGGVLRKEDEEKYRKMFPQLSDTPDVARNKLSIAQRMLAQKYESDKSALGGSGYDVSAFGSLPVPESLFGGGGGKIRVSNGQETLLIDPADEADAAKDGFRRAQ